VVEGVVPINLCVANGLLVRQIVFADYHRLSQWAKNLIEEQTQAELYSVTPGLMAEISDRDEGSEVMILAKQPEYDAGLLRLNRMLVLDRPSNPGNFGAIVRTCNSFGVDAIFISGHGIDAYDPKSITASRGTVFSLPIVKLGSRRELETILNTRRRSPGFSVYGSSARAGVDLRSVGESHQFALIIGNETTGMTPYLRSVSDTILRIPIHGEASSLNAACAASILLYELSKGAVPA